MRVSTLLLTSLLAISLGCDRADQERARADAERAKQKTVAAAQKLGTETEQKAKELNNSIAKSLDGQHPDGTTSATSSPNEKADKALEIGREKGREATVKLTHAGMLARVKARLASDVGLSAVANVSVDAAGPVVTLSGHVSSEDQKRQAERAVSNVDGVTQVVNNLTVQP